MCLCTIASFCHSQIASEPWCLRCTVSSLLMLIRILMILLSSRLCFDMLLLWMRFHPMQLTGNWFEMLWKCFLLVTSVFLLVATRSPVQNYVCVASVNCIVCFTFITTLHCCEADLLVQLVWEEILVLYQLYMCVQETYSIMQQEWALQHRDIVD